LVVWWLGDCGDEEEGVLVDWHTGPPLHLAFGLG
jgi:hypothetical protein